MASTVKRSQPKQSLKYDAVMLFWRTVTQIFFREIRPRGAFNIPRDGPVIFVGAPHNNQFLDPLLLSLEVYRETHRQVQFLTAAKSMERQWVGFFARLMDSIPVARAADYAKPATGRIWLSPDDPCLVLGEGTQFTKELSPKMQIMLPKSANSAVAEVSEVLSDTELKIKREFGGDSGKGTAKIRELVTELRQEGVPGLEFKKMPFVDQQSMYRHVYECLNEGGSMGIFPEGGSHDRTDLLPLKAGVSVMALGAMANDPNLKVKIVPVGLSYFHAHRFRSRAVVEFGTALDVPPEYVEMFKEGGTAKREAVSKFLNLIYDGLKTVTIRAPDYDTLMASISSLLFLFRELIQDEPRVQKLRADVLKYNRLLRDLGLRDHQVPRAKKASWKTLGLLTYRMILLTIWALLALPGTILNAPMFITASILSRKKAKEALAASPLFSYTFYAIVATIIVVRAKLAIQWRIATPLLTIISLPFMNYAALKFGEAGMDVLKSLPPLVIALIPGQQRYLNRAKQQRVQLANEVADLINEFGPKLYDDFNQSRILVPSASVPPSTGTPGLWRRKSGTGAVDAQGLGLIHPMTWIDERLFGWSRSAKRGTSAWSGFSGDEASRIGTPDETDEEDTGDYDNVVGIVTSSEDVNAKLKSRQSSYADLQRLRHTHAPSNAAGKELLASALDTSSQDIDGLHPTDSHRKRRASLSGNVSVGRIAALDRREDFDHATQDLNSEVSSHLKGVN
ncbi:hypothetical protein NP233_g11104 [Leucocoprinus birnbaumii]|uniref:Phospholipid/glycerol acyltransferase domain-containing protein n=1 Tax=Leucocoprinus birnbaumii TaxID=56174 RepID=A0AAD5VJI4_9AGAR|nr:hypothetical protein NP233_g11104 [Leucocoprinus birnbaumii]